MRDKHGAGIIRLRRIFSRAPVRAAALPPRIVALTNAVLDVVAPYGDDVVIVETFTEPLPIAASCPACRRRNIRRPARTARCHRGRRLDRCVKGDS